MWTGKITDAGAALMAEWASGKVINITRAASATGVYDTASLKSSTALNGEKQALGISAITKKKTGTEIKVLITAASETYLARQIGIFGTLDGGDETLIAIYQSSDSGIEVPAVSSMADFVYSFYALISAGNEVAFSCTVDSGTFATKDDLEEAKKTVIPVKYGGTGATDASQARRNLAITADNIGAVSKLGGKMTGDLSLSGGTSQIKIMLYRIVDTYQYSLRLAVDSDGSGQILVYKGNTEINRIQLSTSETVLGQALAVESGGTGATNAAMARTKLGITPQNIGAAPSVHTHNQLVKDAGGVFGKLVGQFDDYNANQLGFRIAGTYSATDATVVALSMRVDRDTGKIYARTDSKAGDLYPRFYTSSDKPLPSEIGALSLTGGNLTGALKLPYLEVLHADWPSVALGSKDNGRIYGTFFANPESNRLGISMQVEGSPCSEHYMLPVPDVVSDDTKGWYQILTNKNAVLVSQGGTGATTKSGARKNLGLEIQAGTGDLIEETTPAKNITFAAAFSSVPVVTVTPTKPGIMMMVTDITKNGFRIEASDFTGFNWQAVYIS